MNDGKNEFWYRKYLLSINPLLKRTEKEKEEEDILKDIDTDDWGS